MQRDRGCGVAAHARKPEIEFRNAWRRLEGRRRLDNLLWESELVGGGSASVSVCARGPKVLERRSCAVYSFYEALLLSDTNGVTSNRWRSWDVREVLKDLSFWY